MSDEAITCTSLDCSECQGGMCKCAAVAQTRHISAAEVLFLSESNNIEQVCDTASLLQAIKAWVYRRAQPSLTPAVITKIHGMLMRRQNLLPEDKGAFRTGPVWIGGREGKPWYAVPALIEAWRERAPAARTAEQIQTDHVQYEVIHPFVDGNGRTGRMLLNWQRLRADLPILIIKEAEKRKYYAWFSWKDKQYVREDERETMTRGTIEFDPTNEKDVYGAVRAACGTLETFGNYTVSLVPVPGTKTADQPATETPATTDQPVEQAAPDAAVDPSAPSVEQVAPDAAVPAEATADQQPQ